MSDEGLTKNFDIMVPRKRTAVIGNEEIDVSFIPARAMLNFVAFTKKYDAKTIKSLESGETAGFDPDMLEDILEVIEGVCKRSSKKITKDWLLDNVPFDALVDFINFVFEGVNSVDVETQKGDDGKNLQSGA